jgi:hypothetical protein
VRSRYASRYFRTSNNDKSLYGEAPKLVGEHQQLAAAIKKVKVGIPRTAVAADLGKRGMDLLDELPPPLQGQKPIAVEWTDI